MPLSINLPHLTKKPEPAYKAVATEPNKSLPDETASVFISGWPTDPQRIPTYRLWIVVDFLLLLLPVAFIALAALAYQLDGQELSDRGKKIQEATLLGPTLFPLAFAALGGRSIKKIALWRAERGTTLGFLEHMIGSQSLVGTVGHAFALRSFSFITICLLVLWALSPLGGQSALRLVHERKSMLLSNRSILYADADAPSEFPTRSYNADAVNRANAVLLTSLMTADTLENFTMDTWNRPKIPRLEVLEQAEERNESSRHWYSVDQSANHSYASLGGINVDNFSETGATNFTVPYEYMYFGCDLSPHNNFTRDPLVTENRTSDPVPNPKTQLAYLNSLNDANMLESSGRFVGNATYLLGTLSYAASDGSPTYGLSERGFFIYSRFGKTKFGNTNLTQTTPQALIYGSNGFPAQHVWLFECSMKSVMVEANIMCHTKLCHVERLRRLNIPRSERRNMYLPYDVVHDLMTNWKFIRHLVGIGGENTGKMANPVDAYIYGNKAWAVTKGGFSPTKEWATYVNDTEKNVPMSHRMTRILNTFYDASRWRIDMSIAPPENSTMGDALLRGMSPMNATQAIVTQDIPVYRADAGWVACLILCSGILLLLGIYSFFLSLRIKAPDIFDFVSSFTRDSPYVKLPASGSTLDGAERARLLRKLPVQLGDANIGEDMGYITIRRVDGEQDCKLGQVRRDRLYR